MHKYVILIEKNKEIEDTLVIAKPPTDSTGPAILQLSTLPSGLFVNSRREEQKEQLLRQVEAVIRSNRTIYRDNSHLPAFAMTCTWRNFYEVLHDNLLPDMRDAFFLIDGTTATVGNLPFMTRSTSIVCRHPLTWDWEPTDSECTIWEPTILHQ